MPLLSLRASVACKKRETYQIEVVLLILSNKVKLYNRPKPRAIHICMISSCPLREYLGTCFGVASKSGQPRRLMCRTAAFRFLGSPV
jgi:hypothetical protein